MKWLLALGLSLLFVEDGWSQDHPQPPPGSGRDAAPRRHPTEMRGHLRKAMDQRMAELERTDPERYKELKVLQETNPRRFVNEMRKELAAHRVPPMRPDNRPGGGRRPPRFDQRLMDQLRKEDPERWEKLQKMRQENPAQARRMVRQMIGAFRRKHFGRDDQARKLAQDYRQTDDEKKRKELKAKIREEVEKSFDNRLEEQERSIERMMKHLETVRDDLEKLREHRDELCEKRVNQLLDPPVPPEADMPDDESEKHPGRRPPRRGRFRQQQQEVEKPQGE